MTVVLQKPYKGQIAGSFYTGADEGALVASGSASLIATTAAGTGPAAPIPLVRLMSPYGGFGVGAIYRESDRSDVVAKGLGYFLGTTGAGTPGVTPTPTPLPSFSVLPSISPTSGQVGATFTGSDGVILNGAVTSRRWLLGGSAIGAGGSVVPNATGSLIYEVTIAGPGGGPIVGVSTAVTISAASSPVTLSGSLPQASRGTAYSAPLSIVGGTGPFTASLAGAPAGLGVTVSGRTLTLAWSNPQ